jgi:hypothetical protein
LNINDYINLRNVSEFVLSDYSKEYAKLLPNDLLETIFRGKMNFDYGIGEWKSYGDLPDDHKAKMTAKGELYFKTYNADNNNVTDGVKLNLPVTWDTAVYPILKFRLKSNNVRPIYSIGITPLQNNFDLTPGIYREIEIDFRTYLGGVHDGITIDSLNFKSYGTSNGEEVYIDDIQILKPKIDYSEISLMDLNKSIIEFSPNIENPYLNSSMISYSSTNNGLLTELDQLNNVYQRHTVIKKSEFDLLEVIQPNYTIWDGINSEDYGSTGLISVLNTDGSRSEERAKLMETNMATDNYSFVDTEGYALDIFASPDEQGLYSQPIMIDNNGRIDYINCPYETQTRQKQYYDKIYVDPDRFSVYTPKGSIYSQNPDNLAYNVFDNSHYNSCGIWENNSPGGYVGDFVFYERHSERIIPGLSMIQGGIGAKGLIATLPMLDWNKHPINIAEGIKNKIFITSGLNLLSNLQYTNNVRGNSDNEYSNYLYTMQNALKPGKQFTNEDKTAHLLVRIPSELSATKGSIEASDTRVIEGISYEYPISQSETLGINDATGYIPSGETTWQSEYSHYPLYTLNRNGEFDRTGDGITYQLNYNSYEGKVLPIPDIRYPTNNRQNKFIPYYVSNYYAVIRYNIDDYELGENSTNLTEFNKVKNEMVTEIPINISLNKLVGQNDVSNNILINISEFDNANDFINTDTYEREFIDGKYVWNEHNTTNSSNLQNYFKNDITCVKDGDNSNPYNCSVNSKTSNTEIYNISDQIKLGAFDNGQKGIPLQILTIENINLSSKIGSEFNTLIIGQNGETYTNSLKFNDFGNKSYALGLSANPTQINDSENYIWKDWDYGNDNLVNYVKYRYNSEITSDFDMLQFIYSIRTGTQGDMGIPYLGDGQLNTSKSKIHYNDQLFTWSNTEEGSRSLSYGSNPRSSSAKISNDFYKDNIDLTSNWDYKYSTFTKNGGSNGMSILVYSYDSNNEGENRNRSHHLTGTKNLIFTTGLKSRIERENFYNSVPLDQSIGDSYSMSDSQKQELMQNLFLLLIVSMIFMQIMQFAVLGYLNMIGVKGLGLMTSIGITTLLITAGSIFEDVVMYGINPFNDILAYSWHHILPYIVIGASLGALSYYMSKAVKSLRSVQRFEHLMEKEALEASRSIYFSPFSDELKSAYRSAMSVKNTKSLTTGKLLTKYFSSINTYSRLQMYNLIGNAFYNFLPPGIGQIGAGLSLTAFASRNVSSNSYFIALFALSAIVGFEALGSASNYKSVDYFDFFRYIALTSKNDRDNLLSNPFISYSTSLLAVGIDLDYVAMRSVSAPFLDFAERNNNELLTRIFDHRFIQNTNGMNSLWAEYGLIRDPTTQRYMPHEWINS